MKSHLLRSVILLPWSLFLLARYVVGQPPQKALTLNIQPDTVAVTAFYKGAALQVSGDSPNCDNIIIILEGKDE